MDKELIEDFSFIVDVAGVIRTAVLPLRHASFNRDISGIAFSGDSTFEIDKHAEDVLFEYLNKLEKPLAYFSEDRGLVKLCDAPKWLLIVDPIDGTRPLLSGLEMGVVSIALCPFLEKASFQDILASVVFRIPVEEYVYAEKGKGIQVNAFGVTEENLSSQQEIEKMFWSFDLVGRPVSEVVQYLGELIDSSGMQAGAFLFHNAAFSLLKIIVGHFDAYVDVGGRLLREHPESESEFLKIGQGRVMGTFPYDIAAAYLIMQEAGAVLTDAFGESLADVRLINSGKQAILSCVAASNSVLHKKILTRMNSLKK